MEKGGPYPLIVLPQFGGYWIEDPENLGTPTSLGSSICEEEEEDSLSPNTFGYKLECRGEARAYRRHFLGKVRPRALGVSSCGRGSAPGNPVSLSSAPFSLSFPPWSCPFLAACLHPSPWRGPTGSAPGLGVEGVQKSGRLSVRAPCGDHPSKCFRR